MKITATVATDNRRAIITFWPSRFARMFGRRVKCRMLVHDDASHRWRFELSGVEAPYRVLVAIEKALKAKLDRAQRGDSP